MYGAKGSHHRRQTHVFQSRHVCLCTTGGDVRRGISGRNVALNTTSSSVVQRHTPWHWNACICRLWCEGFAPQTASARLPIPSFLPLHHKETLRYGMLSCVPEKDEKQPAQRILYESIKNDRHGSISIDTDIES